MDRAVIDPPPTHSTKDCRFRPYVCQLEREAFIRTDPTRLRKQAFGHAPGLALDEELFVHIPFNETEHKRVLEYLLVSQFFDPSIPTHMLPTQLVYAKGRNEAGIHRHPVSILEYLSDMVLCGSSLRNADDVVLSLPSRARCFPALFRRVDVDICGFLPRPLDNFTFVHGDCAFGSAALLFVAGKSPMVISLALRTTDSRGKWASTPRFLMNEKVSLETVEMPVYCSDHQRFICFAEGGFLTFFDLTRTTRYRTDVAHKTIPSFKSVSFPTEPVWSVCGMSTPDGMVIAGTSDTIISIWKYECEHQTIRKLRELLIASPLFMKWIDPQRIVTVREDCTISIIAIGNQKPKTFSIDTPMRFVDKCHGDALVLQSLDNTLVRVMTIANPLGQFEISPDPPFEIACCAYAKRTFVAAFTDCEGIVIWDQGHLHNPLMIELGKVRMIYPVAILDGEPQLFAIVTPSNLMWIDVHGRKSLPVQQPPQTFYDPDGYFTYHVDETGNLVVSWFMEEDDPRFRPSDPERM
jgi:hypothetical protein